MILVPRAAAIALAMMIPVVASAQSLLACPRFTADVIAAPEPREAAYPLRRFDEIKRAVKTEPYRALYLGDSITQGWDPTLWKENMARRGVLNAGVSGDRTEHLVWRLDHGNLDGPPPKVAIVMIGTNDIGHGRSVEDAAEGVRAVLLKLRVREPAARILLLGLTPRGPTPADPLRKKVEAVNKLIRTCGDNKIVYYADIGGVLLDPHGDLTHAISPDLLHFTAEGYARIAPLLDRLLDPLLGRPSG